VLGIVLSGCLLLTGNAFFKDYLTAISNVFYVNTNSFGNPRLQNRRIELNVWDRRASEPASTPRVTLIAAVSNINISAINNPPILHIPNDTYLVNKEFISGGDSVILFPNLNISDVDDEYLSSAICSITDKFARGQDELFFDPINFAGASNAEIVYQMMMMMIMIIFNTI
jgi:hypothetical protein